MTSLTSARPAPAVTGSEPRKDVHAVPCEHFPHTHPSPRAQDGWPVYRRLMLEQLAGIIGSADAIPFVLRATHSPRILRIGIDRDLIASFPRADVVELRRWLRWWTRSHFYCLKLANGAKHRHDLEGVDVEPIDASHTAHAARLLGIKTATVERKVSLPAPSKRTLSLPALPKRKPSAQIDATKRPRKLAQPHIASQGQIKEAARERRQIVRIVAENTERSHIERILARARRR